MTLPESKRNLLGMAVAAAIIVIVWLISPLVTGNVEVWDGSMAFYLIGLFAAGFAARLIAGGSWWSHFIGVVVAQAIYLIVMSWRNEGPSMELVGIIISALYSVVSIAGSLVAKQIRPH